MTRLEAIERATLAAVPPQVLEVVQGWLVGLDDGTVSRARSAAPLAHRAPAAASVAAVEARYARAGLPALFRLPQVPAFDATRTLLQARGYAPSRPTWLQMARLHEVPVAAAPQVALAPSADAGWEQVFLGEGFDAADGASRLAILRRAQGSLFASVREGDRTVAVGAACFHGGWCGVHAMRTLPAYRRRGLARAIVATLASAARERGFTQAFLQVEQSNTAAQALYTRLGFTTAWGYAYWSVPSA
jgi:GNAT superfamily N-acetyltransferase